LDLVEFFCMDFTMMDGSTNIKSVKNLGLWQLCSWRLLVVGVWLYLAGQSHPYLPRVQPTV